MDQQEIALKVKEGWLHCTIIIEIAGWPKEHVGSTLKLIVDKLKKEKAVSLIKEKISEPKKVSEKIWSAFVELDVLVKSLVDLIGLVFDYMPSSVEIIEPETIKESTQGLGELLNDLIAKLHAYDAAVKKLKAVNTILGRELEKFKQKK